jgi:hypothetical protein
MPDGTSDEIDPPTALVEYRASLGDTATYIR